MPIHLAPKNRRAFLSDLALGGAALSLAGTFPRPASAGAGEPSGRYVALLADTHIDADPERIVRGDMHLSANLRAAVDDVLAQPEPPEALVVVGDLALKDGRAGDYEQLVKLLAPLRERGIPVHLTLGNHDDRANFRKILNRVDEAGVDHCATVVDAAGMRLVLLDSLDEVDQVPGLIGDAQVAWLASSLDAAPEAPTIVLVHHHLSATPQPEPGALQDASALLEVLRPRRQVKALVYGHTHVWDRREEDGIHFLNLPAVAYRFQEIQPLGWCRLAAHPDGRGASLVLRCTGGDRSRHGERIELAWRGD